MIPTDEPHFANHQRGSGVVDHSSGWVLTKDSQQWLLCSAAGSWASVSIIWNLRRSQNSPCTPLPCRKQTGTAPAKVKKKLYFKWYLKALVMDWSGTFASPGLRVSDCWFRDLQGAKVRVNFWGGSIISVESWLERMHQEEQTDLQCSTRSNGNKTKSTHVVARQQATSLDQLIWKWISKPYSNGPNVEDISLLGLVHNRRIHSGRRDRIKPKFDNLWGNFHRISKNPLNE